MNIYNYHPSTKVFLGVSKADPDPLDEGNWLIPAHATTLATPQIPAGKVAVWKGSAWAIETPTAPTPAPVPPVATSEEKRATAYQAESDPLFFKWQRGEGTKEAWLSKVSEIKARYP